VTRLDEARASASAGLKPIGSTKYVELSVECFWTRVRFPPPPPEFCKCLIKKKSNRIKGLKYAKTPVGATQLKENAVQTHVTRRGNMFIFRRRIPADLVAHYGRKEIQQALGTAIRQEADKLGRALSVQFDKQFDATRAKLQADANGKEHSTGSLPEIPTSTDKGQIPSANAELSAVGDVLALAARILTRLRQQREKAITDDKLEDFLHFQSSQMEWDKAALVGKADPLYPAWKHEAFLIARQQLLEPGRYPALSTAEKVQPATPAQAVPATASITLAELIPIWEKDKNLRDPKTAMKARLVVRRFTELVGPLPVHEITRKHCIDFRDALRDEGQSIANTNNYLARLSALFNVAHDRDFISQSPATRLTLKDGEKKRYPFDTPALLKIFTSSIYTHAERPKGGAGEAAHWLPLLALFTGARVEELAQLHPNDVRLESYDDSTGNRVSAWIIGITSAGEGQEVKNAGSVRIVPVHVELIRLGFVQFVDARRDKHRIFHELRTDITGRESGTWSKWFGRWLRKQCAVSDKGLVFHSFRYSFKDLCREVGIEEDVHDALTGHAGSNTVARAYSSGQYPLRPLVQGMQKFRLPAELQQVFSALPQYRA
jgi:integrase